MSSRNRLTTMVVVNSMSQSSSCPPVVHNNLLRGASSFSFDFNKQLVCTQLACLVEKLQTARKMRVPVPSESTRGALTDSAARAGLEPSAEGLKGTHLGRRYSSVQDEEGEVDSFDSSSLMNRFNSIALFNRLRGGGAPNLYEKSSQAGREDVFSASKSFGQQGTLTKALSNTDLNRQNAAAATTEPEAQPSGGIVSRYLGRRGSTGSVLKQIPADALQSLQKKAGSPSAGDLAATTSDVTDSAASSSSSSTSARFSLLSKTRQFGAWISKTTDGEKVEVSKKDLNMITPSSF